MPPERTSAPNDSVGSIRTKGAKALDNVQTDELQHLGFEQAVRRELLHVHQSRDWVHPAGSTQITRYHKVLVWRSGASKLRDDLHPANKRRA